MPTMPTMQGVPKTYRVVQGIIYSTLFNTHKWVEGRSRERERGQARRCQATRSLGCTHAAGIDGQATIGDLSGTAENVHYEKRDGSIKKEVKYRIKVGIYEKIVRG